MKPLNSCLWNAHTKNEKKKNKRITFQLMPLRQVLIRHKNNKYFYFCFFAIFSLYILGGSHLFNEQKW